METISPTEANRHFLSLLKEVAKGTSFAIISQGKPVAYIQATPSEEQKLQKSNTREKKDFFASLAAQGQTGTPRNWTRDELYENIG